MTSIHFSGRIEQVKILDILDELEENGEFKNEVTEAGCQSFKNWTERNPLTAIEMPILSLYQGKLAITNGRHRLLALSSRGYRKIFVEIK